MTLKSGLLSFLAIISFLISCKKEVSREDGKNPGQVESSWKFTSNGTQFSGDMDSAFIQTAAGFSALTAVGSQPNNGSGEIVISIVSQEIKNGPYSGPDVSFVYAESGQIVYQRVPGQEGTFTVTITAIDSSEVTGVFSGTVYDAAGQPHEITEGTFTAPFSSAFEPNPDVDGQLTVWAKQMCTDGGSVEVLVQGQQGFITEATTQAPDCGDPRAATFTLPQGTWVVSAICGTDTINYEVTIASACTKLEVQFPAEIEGDYLPLTVGSTWEYTNLDPNVPVSHIVTAGTDTVADGRQYWIHASNLPDTFLFRKQEHAYYQYLTVDFNGSVTNASPIELPILYDDYATGQSWEVGNIPVRLSNIDVLARFTSTITNRDYSVDIGGIRYDNCIEVTTELAFKPTNSPDYTPVGSVRRVFAKGIGIVAYDDLDRGAEWGLTNHSIAP